MNWKSKHILRLRTVKYLPFCESVVLFPIHLYCIVRVLLRCQVSQLYRSASSAWLSDDKNVKSSQLRVWWMWATLFVSIWHLNGISELMVATWERIKSMAKQKNGPKLFSKIFKFYKSAMVILSHACIDLSKPLRVIEKYIPSHPVDVTSANGLSQRLHWRPMTPPLQGHCPVTASHVRDSEPREKHSQG